jgi:2-methylcitrate dehydratase PrpD
VTIREKRVLIDANEGSNTVTISVALAEWAHRLVPAAEDLALAQRALRDTVAVALAAADQPVVAYAAELGTAGAWAAAAHVLDFDDLHVESTSHISAVIVPAVLATGGGARAYLAGAGVMARLGAALGWSHYTRGWHATCTAGAPAAAAAAAVALGLDAERTAHAIALAIPAAGGVQRAFGTDAKSIQVGMAADAGVRAARLARRGARADLTALEPWLALLGASSVAVDTAGPAVPGGLAIKLFPCCYAMQRPIHAVRAALGGIAAADVAAVHVATPAGTVQPLIHHRPRTGLEAKFSLEYAIAAALLDDFPSFASFTDAGVGRPAAAAIMEAVSLELGAGGDGLLDGTCAVELRLRDGTRRRASIDHPPGSPGRPPTDEELARKIAGCGPRARDGTRGLGWRDAARLLADQISGSRIESKLDAPLSGTRG